MQQEAETRKKSKKRTYKNHKDQHNIPLLSCYTSLYAPATVPPTNLRVTLIIQGQLLDTEPHHPARLALGHTRRDSCRRDSTEMRRKGAGSFCSGT